MTRTEYNNFISTLLASNSNITAAELRTAMGYAADFAAEQISSPEFTPIAKDQFGTHPAAPTLMQALAYLYGKAGSGGVTENPDPDTGAAPAAPNLEIDNVFDVARVTPVPLFLSLTDYEIEII